MRNNTSDRLFVPLSNEPFEDFRDHGKRFEMRALGGNFTEKFVYSGRSVELRRGYSKREGVPEPEWRLWGSIGLVVVGDLDEVFYQVGDHRLIMPRTENRQTAFDEVVEIIGSHDEYIGFEVVLDLSQS